MGLECRARGVQCRARKRRGLSIDVRHAHDDVRTEAVARIRKHATVISRRSRGVEFRFDQEEHHPAVPADPALSGLLGEAVVGSGHAPHRLTSGAGHDAAVMAAVAPMAMLFVRSPGGVSHSPLERVLEEDVAWRSKWWYVTF